jgi:HAD superfamily hydrolase (TIGR01549 family)
MDINSTSAVIFDLDGTLTEPALDFDAIRAEIGGVTGPILEAMARMTPHERARAEAILVERERQAAERAVLYEGAIELLPALRERGFRTAILTRNTRATVNRILERFDLDVDAVRTREDGAIKPSAEPVRSICNQLRTDARCSWMVGDYLFDILSGKAAGTKTVLMIGDGREPPFAGQADFVIRRLRELLPIVGLPG